MAEFAINTEINNDERKAERRYCGKLPNETDEGKKRRKGCYKAVKLMKKADSDVPRFTTQEGVKALYKAFTVYYRMDLK
jgi:hypothetical protein